MSNTRETAMSIESECESYCEHLNGMLKLASESGSKKSVLNYLPLTVSNLFQKLRDGIVLAHLIDFLSPGIVPFDRISSQINIDQINQPKTKVIFEVTNNLNICIESAKKIKQLVVVNIGANDVLEMNKDLVLGLLWQIIRCYLLQSVNLTSHPQLIRLLASGETLNTLLNMRSEQILLRWFNYHLRRAGSNSSVENFSTDIQDCKNYLLLIGQIGGKNVDSEQIQNALEIDDIEFRARVVLENAAALSSKCYVTIKDILNGNSRLNLAFTATLFNHAIGIQLPTEEEIAELLESLENAKLLCAEYEKKLDQMDSSNSTLVSNLQVRVHELESQLQAERQSHASQLKSFEKEMNLFREEVESRYRESYDTKFEQETATIQENSKRAVEKERETRRNLERQLRQLRGLLLQANASGKKTDTIGTSGGIELDTLTKEITEMTKAVVSNNSELSANVEQLNEKIKQNDRLNNVMAGKIREFSEMLISEKKAPKRMFSLRGKATGSNRE